MTKPFVRLLVPALFLWLLAPGVRAQEDQYLRIYTLIQEGSGLLEESRSSQALAKFVEARTSLQQFQRAFPEWNPDVVKFRMDYLGARIAELTAKLQQSGEAGGKPTPPARGVGTGQVEKPEPSRSEEQLKVLQQQLQTLQQDKALLEEKLKEALAARPAAVDPQEMARAEERIKELQKQNDLLTSSLSAEKSQAVKVDSDAVARLQKNLDDVTGQLVSERENAAKLARENQNLQAQLKSSPRQSSDSAMLRKEKDLIKRLERERDDYKSKYESASKELNSRKSRNSAAKLEQLQKELATLRSRLKVLESDRVPFTAEEMAMMRKSEPRLSTETASTAVTPAVSDSGSATNRPGATGSKEMPASALALVAEGRKAFAARQLDQAEEKFQAVVRQANNHPQALTDLATVQMENGKLDEAEKTARQALESAPDDAYALSVLGQIEFRRSRVDAAIGLLSRSAEKDPRSADVQNWLGVALSQKGLRAPAEAALRKAIQLEPRHAQAHNNLALIYADQKPPMLELARWHYQKALSLGMPANTPLEKVLGITR